jgi:hypothetical protein
VLNIRRLQRCHGSVCCGACSLKLPNAGRDDTSKRALLSTDPLAHNARYSSILQLNSGTSASVILAKDQQTGDQVRNFPKELGPLSRGINWGICGHRDVVPVCVGEGPHWLHHLLGMNWFLVVQFNIGSKCEGMG